MNKTYDLFLKYANNNYKRNLTWLDRDPDSPTYGSFDRNFWHYKTSDFNSDILQQGIYTLIALYKKEIPNNYNKNKLKNLIFSSVKFIILSFKENKKFNEYYPNEDGYPPHAFLSNVLGDIFFYFPEFLKLPDFENTYIKINQSLSKRYETKASNQYATALAGLYKFVKNFPQHRDMINIEKHKKILLSLQDKEGWFVEYNGFDLGYLSITLEALTEIYKISLDEDFLNSINSIIDFYYNIVDKDGNFPFTLNSRNTEYVLPFGFLNLEKKDKKINYLIDKIFSKEEYFSNLIGNDDRYHSHYIFANILKSLNLIKDFSTKENIENTNELYLENAGLYKKHDKENNITLYIGLKKGGIFRIHNHKNNKILLQNGFRAIKTKKVYTNNFQSKHWNYKLIEKKIICEGSFVKSQFNKSTPIKHFFLRVLSSLFGNKIIDPLKKLLIFNKKSTKLKYRREINIEKNRLKIKDSFFGFQNYKIKLNPKQNLRYVASADIFSDEDLAENIIDLDETIIKEPTYIIENYYEL